MGIYFIEKPILTASLTSVPPYRPLSLTWLVQPYNNNPFEKETQTEKELTPLAKFIRNCEDELSISDNQLIINSHISNPTLWRIYNDYSSKDEGRYIPGLQVIQKLCFGLQLHDDKRRLEYYDLMVFQNPCIIECLKQGMTIDETNDYLYDHELPTLTKPNE